MCVCVCVCVWEREGGRERERERESLPFLNFILILIWIIITNFKIFCNWFKVSSKEKMTHCSKHHQLFSCWPRSGATLLLDWYVLLCRSRATLLQGWCVLLCRSRVTNFKIFCNWLNVSSKEKMTHCSIHHQLFCCWPRSYPSPVEKKHILLETFLPQSWWGSCFSPSVIHLYRHSVCSRHFLSFVLILRWSCAAGGKIKPGYCHLLTHRPWRWLAYPPWSG